MTKRLLVIFLAIGMSAHLSGCSSSGSKGEDGQQASNDSQFSQEGEGDFAQDGTQTQVAQDGQAGANQALDGAPQDGGQDLALDGQQSKSGDQAKAGGKDELSLEDPQPLPEDVASNQQPAPPADAAAQAKPEEAPAPAPADQAAAAPPTDEPLFKDQAQAKPEEAPAAAPADAAAPTETTAAAEPPKTFAPLLKVKDAAFEKNGTNLNRVYLAREGDTLKSVSQKLYGKNRQKDLKAWNPVLGRGVKTGDKIYYQSPTNPDDKAMLTYYEEAGIQPSIYTSKEGDNIRQVSKELLGSKDSWKEVWATNASVESKGNIPAGLEIKYWPENAVAQAGAAGKGSEVAANVAPPVDQAPPPPPPEQAPPPPQNMAANGAANSNMAPPPPPADPKPASTPDNAQQAAGAIAPPPEQAPPPPPPPPPPEPKPVAKKAPPKEAVDAGDQDQMMMIGMGGILLMAAAVLFIVLKKNRAKRVDLSQTQV